MKKKLGYPDLTIGQEVSDALVYFGLFSEKLPPCFNSRGLKLVATQASGSKHAAVRYLASKNIDGTRYLSIPHPEAYIRLCDRIKEYWDKINEHVGKSERKISYCHVRKILDAGHIFEMNYEGDKHEKEDIEHRHYMGCRYVVKADISTCFPSIYTHSITWAVRGLQIAKENVNDHKHWSSRLDKAVRNCNHGQTNGLLIGPHAFNIISELILTKIDCELQDNGFTKLTRHIDDYTYFAKDENEAQSFLKALELELDKFQLHINREKTKQLTFAEYCADDWATQLAISAPPSNQELEYPTISAYINQAISLAVERNNAATITYAIRVVVSLNLSIRARHLFVRKILATALVYPYLLPYLDDVFALVEKELIPQYRMINGKLYHLYWDETFFGSSHYLLYKEDFSTFLSELVLQSLSSNLTDGLAYAFYFAMKYDIPFHDKLIKCCSSLPIDAPWYQHIINLNDCISTLLAFVYCKRYKIRTIAFGFNTIQIKRNTLSQDKFWLYLYEYSNSDEELPTDQSYLKHLKRKKVTFLNSGFSLDSETKATDPGT